MGRRVFTRHIDPRQVQGHVSPDVLTTEIALGAHESHECSVVFFDLVNFTNISWSLSTSEILSVIQPLFQRAAAQIDASKGIVDKFPGDGVVGFFPRYYSNEHNTIADDALDCATKVMNWFYTELRPSLRLPKPSHTLELCAGVDAGTMAIAHVGSVIHSELILLGDQVNCASKCEAVAEKKEVVVGQGAVELLHYGGFYSKYLSTGPSLGVVYTSDNRPYRSFRFDWQQYAEDYDWAR